MNRDKLVTRMEDGEVDNTKGLEVLASMDKILGKDEDIIVGDPLVDKWEREFAAGETPDLDER